MDPVSQSIVEESIDVAVPPPTVIHENQRHMLFWISRNESITTRPGYITLKINTDTPSLSAIGVSRDISDAWLAPNRIEADRLAQVIERTPKFRNMGQLVVMPVALTLTIDHATMKRARLTD